jgi:YtkA-like protein
MSRCLLLPADPVFLKRSLVVALCACFVLSEACAKRQQRSAELSFAYEISPQPPRVGPVTIVLRVTDFSGAPFTGAHLDIEGNMSHAGMAPVFAGAKEIEPGRYRAVLDLSMAGDWTVTAHVTWSTNRKADYVFELNGVEP